MNHPCDAVSGLGATGLGGALAVPAQRRPRRARADGGGAPGPSRAAPGRFAPRRAARRPLRDARRGRIRAAGRPESRQPRSGLGGVLSSGVARRPGRAGRRRTDARHPRGARGRRGSRPAPRARRGSAGHHGGAIAPSGAGLCAGGEIDFRGNSFFNPEGASFGAQVTSDAEGLGCASEGCAAIAPQEKIKKS